MRSNKTNRAINDLVKFADKKLKFKDLLHYCVSDLEKMQVDVRCVFAYILELEARLETKQLVNLDNVEFEKQHISKAEIRQKYLEMEREYSIKVYDDKYDRQEVKKEEFYKRQVYEDILGD